MKAVQPLLADWGASTRLLSGELAIKRRDTTVLRPRHTLESVPAATAAETNALTVAPGALPAAARRARPHVPAAHLPRQPRAGVCQAGAGRARRPLCQGAARQRRRWPAERRRRVLLSLSARACVAPFTCWAHGLLCRPAPRHRLASAVQLHRRCLGEWKAPCRPAPRQRCAACAPGPLAASLTPPQVLAVHYYATSASAKKNTNLKYLLWDKQVRQCCGAGRLGGGSVLWVKQVSPWLAKRGSWNAAWPEAAWGELGAAWIGAAHPVALLAAAAWTWRRQRAIRLFPALHRVSAAAPSRRMSSSAPRCGSTRAPRAPPASCSASTRPTTSRSRARSA